MNHKQKLSIAIPASIISDVPHLREKTLRIGLIGRAAAIFRVHEIIVFPDAVSSDQNKEAHLIKTILSYMETPQYLRKRLFKIKPELRYAGILPPLRTPHHPLINKLKDLTVGEFREGVVVSAVKNGSLIDIGVERPILIAKTNIPVDTRTTVRIVDLEETPRGVAVSHDEIEEYWGYQVVTSNVTLGRLIRKRPFDLVVATSRYGIPFKQVREKLVKRWKKSQKVLIAFGAPTKGLHDIVAQEGLKLRRVADLIVNTIPNQGTATVRTEEAMYASLAILTSLVEK